MSQRTHVTGSIRVDFIEGLMGRKPDWNMVLGPVSTFENYVDTVLPHGSEGSLQYHVWENTEDSSLAKYTITIWGDLRDYDDEKYIVDYLNRICQPYMIRNACFSMEVEGKKENAYLYDMEKKSFIHVNP